VGLAQTKATVDHRMNDDAARVGLVGVLQDLPAYAEITRDFGVIAARGEHIEKTARGFEPTPGARKARRRK